MGKALDLLAAGAVGVRFTDGWRTRAFVRDGRQLVTVVYANGTWACSGCERPDCSHVRAVAGVVRVI
jgi:hypothetical protein